MTKIVRKIGETSLNFSTLASRNFVNANRQNITGTAPTSSHLIPLEKHARTISIVSETSERRQLDGWVVVEERIVGKYPESERCEDAIVVTEYLVAVIDGATDKSGLLYEYSGVMVSSGKFAALTIADELHKLDPIESAENMVHTLTGILDAALQHQRPGLEDSQRPAASLVVLNTLRNEVWSLGDCQYAVQQADGTVHVRKPVKLIDRVTTYARAAYLDALAAGGRSWEPATGEVDPGREFILPLLRLQGAFANTIGEFGYGVLNGRTVPSAYVHAEPVNHADAIVLASDGYPDINPTRTLRLIAAEEHLDECLLADPACARMLKCTKGLIHGQVSFDDRAWIKLNRTVRGSR